MGANPNPETLGKIANDYGARFVSHATPGSVFYALEWGISKTFCDVTITPVDEGPPRIEIAMHEADGLDEVREALYYPVKALLAHNAIKALFDQTIATPTKTR